MFKHHTLSASADLAFNLGNVFLFLVAGYETTAHTLAYAFILLALYQEEQEAFYQNIKTILPSGRNPVRAVLSPYSEHRDIDSLVPDIRGLRLALLRARVRPPAASPSRPSTNTDTHPA